MDQQFDATANLEDLIDDPTALGRLLEVADKKSEERLWGDPEWSEPRWIHRKDIVRAFLVGVINADAWFSDYSVPPNLEIVANTLCGAISAKFTGKDELVKASLLDLEAFYREFIDATPFAREWNDYPGSGIVSRFSATPSGRTFIDLGALVRNAAIHIRNDRREFDRFNAEFDARNSSIQDTNTAKPVDSNAAVESSLPPESGSPITPEQLEQGRKFIHENFGPYADPLLSALCAEQSVPPHEHKFQLWTGTPNALCWCGAVIKADSTSVPSGQREVWDAAVEIANTCLQSHNHNPERDANGDIVTEGDSPASCIALALEAARDAAPASNGYDQRTLEAASRTCETYADERYAMAAQSEAGTSQHWHHVGEYDAARVCATRIRALATTPVHKGEK